MIVRRDGQHPRIRARRYGTNIQKNAPLLVFFRIIIIDTSSRTDEETFFCAPCAATKTTTSTEGFVFFAPRENVSVARFFFVVVVVFGFGFQRRCRRSLCCATSRNFFGRWKLRGRVGCRHREQRGNERDERSNIDDDDDDVILERCARRVLERIRFRVASRRRKIGLGHKARSGDRGITSGGRRTVD